MRASQTGRICVIGAGPSGLATVKNLLQAGYHNITVFERNRRAGGNWIYSDQPGHSSVYASARSISSKRLSEYEDFPFPASYPAYPSHAQLLEYFESYARRFGVLQYVEFGREVTRVTKCAGPGWAVTAAGGAEEAFGQVFVCNGHHWKPRLPKLDGTFNGPMLHSHDYKGPHSLPGRRVVILGAGNSGCDLAVELADEMREVTVSLRRGYRFVPRFLFGEPSDVFYSRFASLPGPLRRAAGSALLDVIVGRPERWGMPKPDHAFLGSHPIVNTEFPRYVRLGRITTAPDIERLDGRTVRFIGGQAQEFDAILLCTGYEIDFPFFDRNLNLFPNGRVDLFLKTFHPVHGDLFFIGLVQPNGCIWPLADLQAKLAANYLLGTYELPRDAARAARQEYEAGRRHYVDSPRHTIEVDYHLFRRKLLRAIPRSAPAWTAS